MTSLILLSSLLFAQDINHGPMNYVCENEGFNFRSSMADSRIEIRFEEVAGAEGFAPVEVMSVSLCYAKNGYYWEQGTTKVHSQDRLGRFDLKVGHTVISFDGGEVTNNDANGDQDFTTFSCEIDKGLSDSPCN